MAPAIAADLIALGGEVQALSAALGTQGADADPEALRRLMRGIHAAKERGADLELEIERTRDLLRYMHPSAGGGQSNGPPSALYPAQSTAETAAHAKKAEALMLTLRAALKAAPTVHQLGPPHTTPNPTPPHPQIYRTTRTSICSTPRFACHTNPLAPLQARKSAKGAIDAEAARVKERITNFEGRLVEAQKHLLENSLFHGGSIGGDDIRPERA
jgi:hypothetical protein